MKRRVTVGFYCAPTPIASHRSAHSPEPPPLRMSRWRCWKRPTRVYSDEEMIA
jgi:hypothetical protein